MIVVVTGSIGMGKSATARLFAEEGAEVWDADAAVHRLYAKGGGGAEAVGEFAHAAVVDGAVDRARLAALLAERPDLFDRLNAAVHPLVAADRERAFASSTADLFVLDIPLFFEGGGAAAADAVVTTTAPDAVRRARVLERPGMTAEKLDLVVSRQTPDAEKRRRADYVVWTHLGPGPARAAVRAIIADLRRRLPARRDAR